MLPVVWLVVAVLVAVLLTMWVTFTLTRLDRLHARVDAAQAALDAQLVRRAAALQHVAESPDTGVPAHDRVRIDALAHDALAAGGQAAGGQAVGGGAVGGGDGDREQAENRVGRAVAELSTVALRPDAAEELREAAARVLIARRFYNDAVRDTRSLRARRMPRLLHLAGRRELPQFFDIDDTVPAPPASTADSPDNRPGLAPEPAPDPEPQHDPVPAQEQDLR